MEDAFHIVIGGRDTVSKKEERFWHCLPNLVLLLVGKGEFNVYICQECKQLWSVRKSVSREKRLGLRNDDGRFRTTSGVRKNH